MSKLIMVVAGSIDQIPIVKKIKSLGYKVLVINLYVDSPAFAYADYSEVVDVLDKEKCLAIARQYKIDGVLSEACDLALPTVAYIAEHMDLHSLGSKNAALFTNKYMMRNFCRENGFRFPPYALCKTIEDAVGFFEKNERKKMIIKPLDSNASRGVTIINNANDIKEHFAQTLAFSRVEKAVIEERYIEGTEFTVDGVTIGGKHYSLAISEKKHYAYNPNVARELYFSHVNPRFDYEQLREQNNQLVETSLLPDGCLTHAEYKFENGQFYLIEITARGGGCNIASKIVHYLSKMDTYQYFINSAIGLKSDTNFSINSANRRCAVLHFFDVPDHEGFVTSIDGVEEIKQMNNVLEIDLKFNVGDYIKKVEHDGQRIGSYIAVGENEEELANTMDLIDKMFQINVSDNQA